MKTKQSFKIPLTIIMVKGQKTGGYTAFFKQFPEIIAEGPNNNKAIQNLMNAVYDVFKYRSQVKTGRVDPSINIIEKSVNLCLD